MTEEQKIYLSAAGKIARGKEDYSCIAILRGQSHHKSNRSLTSKYVRDAAACI